MISNNKGFSLFWIIIAIFTIGVAVPSISSWYINLRHGISNTSSALTAMSVAFNEWEKISHMSLSEIKAQKSNLQKPYKVGDYTIEVTLGKEGKFVNGECKPNNSSEYVSCFDDTIIKVSKDNELLYTTHAQPLMTDNYSRKELFDELHKYVLNGDYNAENDTGKMVLKTKQDTNNRMLEAYVDGVNIPLYSSAELLGPPDMSSKYNVSLPFTAKETGYLFIHQDNWEQTIVSAVTEKGTRINGLMNFNYPGLMWVPVTKGDYVYFDRRQSAIDMIYFAPCMKVKS